jgi:hypothetical protein
VVCAKKLRKFFCSVYLVLGLKIHYVIADALSEGTMLNYKLSTACGGTLASDY